MESVVAAVAASGDLELLVLVLADTVHDENTMEIRTALYVERISVCNDTVAPLALLADDRHSV